MDYANYILLAMFLVMFLGMLGLIFGVMIWTVLRLVRAGGFTNALLGGTIVHSFPEMTARPVSRLVKTVIRVHALQTDTGPAVGVTLTHSGPTSWRRTGFAIESARCPELIRQIEQAAYGIQIGSPPISR